MSNLINRLIFPAPDSSYQMNDFATQRSDKDTKYIWIPRNKILSTDKYKSCPALLSYQKDSQYIALYSHGNGCDIGQMRDELTYFFNEMMSDYWVPRGCPSVSFLAYEYTGYGPTKGNENTCEESCIRDINSAYDFVTKILGYAESNVVVFGRSIGTGPSIDLTARLCELGTSKPPALLILQSSYKSIRHLVKEMVGPLTYLVSQRFDNKSKIDKITCPVMFIHGKDDTLISWQHTQKLYELCKSKKNVYYDPFGTHNTWIESILQDKIQDSFSMIDESKIESAPNQVDLSPYLEQPENVTRQGIFDSISNISQL